MSASSPTTPNRSSSNRCMVRRAEPDMIVTEVPAHQTTQIRSSMTMSPAAVVAGIASIVLLLFGAINVARAGIDGAWRDPIVEVASYQGTAVLGLIALGAGIALLSAAFSRDRGAIMFVSIVLGRRRRHRRDRADRRWRPDRDREQLRRRRLDHVGVRRLRRGCGAQRAPHEQPPRAQLSRCAELAESAGEARAAISARARRWPGRPGRSTR